VTKHNGIMDVGSVLVMLGVAANWLPTFAALLGCLWTAIRLYEWVRWRIIENRHEEYK